MKRSISLVLCLAMLISVFSCLGVTASAEGVAKDLFTVKSSGFKNDKITYTVYLNAGVNVSGAIIYASFDPNVLAIDKANTGACMVDDGDGGERESIGGLYETDFMAGFNNQYSIAHAYGQDADYKAGSSNKPYMQFTFKAIDANRPKTKVRLYCYEFNSASIPENNILNAGSENGQAQEFYLFDDTTLSETAVTDVVSEKEGVRITWKKTTGADYYRVYKKVDGEFKIIKSTADGDETTYLDTDVENNTSYTYTVRAMNENGLNSCYDKAGVSTRFTVAPTTLKVSNGDGEVVVSWSAVEGATSYRVYRRTVDADGDVTEWKYISGKITELKFSDMTAQSGNKYEYAVRVYSKGGNSDLYSEKAIVCLALPEFTVKATTSGVKISWDKVSGAEGYKIMRKVKGGSWKTIKTVSSSTTSYTDKSASSGKYNYYAVKAVNGSYISDYDTHALTYIKTPVVSVKNTSSGVRVSWDKVGGATKYYVYRKAGSAKSWTYMGSTKTGAYTDKEVKSGTTYKYCVRAIGSVKSAYGGSSYETIRFLSAPKLENIKSTKSGVTVYWDDVRGADGYIVYRKEGSGSYKKYATVKGKTTVKYLDKSAKKGTTYSYRVYAKYDSCTSSYKSSVSIKDKY